MIASHATRASGSFARIASRIASEIWSASLSGWPSVTDSEVNRVDAVMAISPPLNLPRRQGPASGWEGPQAPGSYLWDAGILAQLHRQIVNAGVSKQFRASHFQKFGRRDARALHHRLKVLSLHLPGRRWDRDWAEDHYPRPVAQPLVVAEHLVMKRELQRARDQLWEAGRDVVVLASTHEADGEELLRPGVDSHVERGGVDHSPIEMLALADPHGRE